MPASQGTPNLLEKLAAAAGFGAAVGMTPEEISATLAGEHRDLTKGEQELVALFGPIFSQAEATGMADLVNMLKGILALVPSVSSVGGAVNIIKTVVENEAGPLQAQVKALGQTSLTTLVSAALAALGKTNLPA